MRLSTQLVIVALSYLAVVIGFVSLDRMVGLPDSVMGFGVVLALSVGVSVAWFTGSFVDGTDKESG